MHPWLIILLVVCATSTVSITVTKSKVMEPLREWLKNKNQWAGKLFSCAYCFSHWTAFLLVGLSGVQAFNNYWINFVLCSFAVVALSTVLSAVMGRLFFMHEDEVYALEKKLKEAEMLVSELLDEA